MNVRRLLDRPIAFHRCFVELTGSINAALMLSQAVYWSKRSTLEDGWFYKSRSEWVEETGLSRYEQEGARERLKKTAFWKENLWGVPPIVHFRVDETELETALLKLGEIPPIDRREASQLNGGKPSNQTEENQPILTTYTENTAEITTGMPVPTLKFPKPEKKKERVIVQKPIRIVRSEEVAREVVRSEGTYGVSRGGPSKAEQREAKNAEVLKRVLGTHSEDSD